MRYPPGFLEEIRSRLPVSAVVGRKVKLRRAGKEWSGLSPFNQEKTASFFVNDVKARWFDFSAGKDGDVFDFLQLTQGLSFTEAVEALAREAGLALPAQDERAEKREAVKLELVEILDKAQRWFQHNLNGTARAYLAGRGVSNAAIDDFGLGFAPDDRSGLKTHLGALGVSVEDAARAGLVIAGPEIPVAYDRFRNRVTVPIRDPAGRVVSFGGRDLSGTAQAKYLNGPETDAFSKGGTLYNGHAARQPAHDGAPVLVVEGYFDVISSVAAGFPATVATMGTALTESHLLALWRLTDCPSIVFDGDKPGRRAAAKAILTALPLLRPGRSLRFATLPAGFDPDKLVRERGAAALAQAVERASGLADTFWQLNTENRSLGSVEARGKAEAELVEALGTIPDSNLRRIYVRNVRERIWRLGRAGPVIRSNGVSNHSASPGSIRMSRGMGDASFMSLREASLIAELVKTGDELELPKGISERTKTVLAEIAYLVSTVPHGELLDAVKQSKVSGSFNEAMSALHQAGIRSLDPE